MLKGFAIIYIFFALLFTAFCFPYILLITSKSFATYGCCHPPVTGCSFIVQLNDSSLLFIYLTPQCHSLNHPGGCNAQFMNSGLKRYYLSLWVLPAVIPSIFLALNIGKFHLKKKITLIICHMCYGKGANLGRHII